MATKTAKKAPALTGLSLRDAQDQAAKFLRNARKQVVSYIPEEPRKRLTQLEARVEKATKELEKARQRAFANARSRVEDFLGDVEKTALGAVKPIVERLDIATKNDVDRLRKRITDLEKRFPKHTEKHGASAAA